MTPAQPFCMADRAARHLVVVGYGMVGHRLVEALLTRDREAGWTVTVLGEEPRPAYDRIALSSLFAGKTEAELRLPDLVWPGVPDQGSDEVRVRVMTSDAVVGIDRDARVVATASGTALNYDALVLATGSAPFVPPIPGADLPGCFVYRTVDDVATIPAASAAARTGVVVGGGLLGLEAADALRRLGLAADIVEFAPRLMPMQVDAGGGEALRREVERLGLNVRTDTRTSGIEQTRGGLRMAFDDDSVLDTDVVVFAAGVRPRDELARSCGLSVGPRGGAVVDDTCRTDDPHIWAIGEVACVADKVYGLVA